MEEVAVVMCGMGIIESGMRTLDGGWRGRLSLLLLLRLIFSLVWRGEVGVAREGDL